MNQIATLETQITFKCNGIAINLVDPTLELSTKVLHFP